MATGWYFEFNGQRHGPVSSNDLKEKAAQGFVTPDTKIWRNPNEGWVPARKIQGLTFGSPSAAANEKPNSDAWYYFSNGQTLGPVTGVQLVGLVSNGVIRRDTLVQKYGTTDWTRADEIPGLADYMQPVELPVRATGDSHGESISRRQSELYATKQRHRNYFKFTVLGAGGVLFASAIFWTIIHFGRSTSKVAIDTNPDNSHPSVPSANQAISIASPKPEEKNVFRKEVFEKAFREVMSFNANGDRSPNQLRIELKLIAGDLKSDSERDFFCGLELIHTVQDSLIVLETCRLATMVPKEIIEKLDKLRASVGGELKPEWESLGERYEAAQKGLVIVLSPHLPPLEQGTKGLLEIFPKVVKLKYGSYLPYEESKKGLKALLAASLKTASELYHKNGQTPK